MCGVHAENGALNTTSSTIQTHSPSLAVIAIANQPAKKLSSNSNNDDRDDNAHNVIIFIQLAKRKEKQIKKKKVTTNSLLLEFRTAKIERRNKKQYMIKKKVVANCSRSCSFVLVLNHTEMQKISYRNRSSSYFCSK